MRSTLKSQVEKILRDTPSSRNSDITLTIELWKRFYPSKIKQSKETGKFGVWLDDLFTLPREDNIKRIRAHFQNDMLKYLPTSLEVVRQRRINEEVWRKTMGMGDVYGRMNQIPE